MATPHEIDEEDRKIRRVRLLVDLASSLIAQGAVGGRQAESLVSLVRQRVLELFPGSERTFDLIYGSRFRRVLEESSGRAEAAIDIPFPGRRPS